MAAEKNAKALKEVRKAQADFERETDTARKRRREAFKKAQASGLSLREIAAEIDLHWTRVGEIIRDK